MFDRGETSHSGVNLVREGSVATVTLYRPDTRGSIDRATALQLRDVFAALAHDGVTRSVILRGTAPDFCSGADIEHMVGTLHDETAATELHEALIAPALCPLPVVVAATGHALGGGLGLFLAGDIRIAVPEAKLGAPCGDLGFFALGSIGVLAHEIGHVRAGRLLLRDEVITAEEGVLLGIVSEVVSHDQIDATAQDIAHMLATKSAVTLRETKALMNQVRYATVAAERQALLRVMSAPDAKAGRARFLALKDRKNTE
jgi:methylglutaconyl-CoA hydratase